MEDKKIKGALFYPEDKKIIEIPKKKIKNRLNALRQDLAELNNYRDRWTDFDVAVICWLVAHDPDEIEFWKETEL